MTIVVIPRLVRGIQIKMKINRLVFVCFFLVLSGCSQVEVKDFKPQEERGGIPPGPGIFSGESGNFELLPPTK